MTIPEFNQLPRAAQTIALQKCCGAHAWVEKMQAYFPLDAAVNVFQIAEKAWEECSEADWLEAFTHHPRIGNTDDLAKKFANTAHWASDEQRGTSVAAQATIDALYRANNAYFDKFGFIFIICATGKSADEMLEALLQRLPNDRAAELKIAAGEQAKITQLRLQKLFV